MEFQIALAIAFVATLPLVGRLLWLRGQALGLDPIAYAAPGFAFYAAVTAGVLLWALIATHRGQ